MPRAPYDYHLDGGWILEGDETEPTLKPTVLVTKRRAPDAQERRSVMWLYQFFDVAPAAGHHDDRHGTGGVIGPVQVGANDLASAQKLDVFTHASPTGV